MRGLHEESEDDEEEEDSRASSARTILGNMFAGSEEKGAKNTRSNPGIKLSSFIRDGLIFSSRAFTKRS